MHTFDEMRKKYLFPPFFCLIFVIFPPKSVICHLAGVRGSVNNHVVDSFLAKFSRFEAGGIYYGHPEKSFSPLFFLILPCFMETFFWQS